LPDPTSGVRSSSWPNRAVSRSAGFGCAPTPTHCLPVLAHATTTHRTPRRRSSASNSRSTWARFPLHGRALKPAARLTRPFSGHMRHLQCSQCALDRVETSNDGFVWDSQWAIARNSAAGANARKIGAYVDIARAHQSYKLDEFLWELLL